MRLVIAISALLISMTPAWGQWCSALTIRGTYGLVCTGTMSPAAGAPQVAFSAIGTAVGDFNGTFTGIAKASIGGAIVDQTVVGTAIIDNDCTGTISYTQKINGQPAPKLNLVFHILDNGKEIRGMSVDAGSTLTCSLRLMNR